LRAIEYRGCLGEPVTLSFRIVEFTMEESLFGIVQEHHFWGLAEIVNRLAYRVAEFSRVESVHRPPIGTRNVANLAGDRKLAENVPGRPREESMRVKPMVVERSVE
jgi:hypothetical protein